MSSTLSSFYHRRQIHRNREKNIDRLNQKQFTCNVKAIPRWKKNTQGKNVFYWPINCFLWNDEDGGDWKRRTNRKISNATMCNIEIRREFHLFRSIVCVLVACDDINGNSVHFYMVIKTFLQWLLWLLCRILLNLMFELCEQELTERRHRKKISKGTHKKDEKKTREKAEKREMKIDWRVIGERRKNARSWREG